MSVNVNCDEGEIMSIENNTDMNNGSVILESQEFNETERDMMKGDTVGDTVYSSKWIINALISLSKVSENGWSKSLENYLCMLWDMTTDKDVVIFLLENEFFKIADFVLRSVEEPRLIEIIIGIIGNMCCHDAALKNLVEMEDLVSLIFNYLSTDDPETLIQIFRLLQAAIWNIKTDKDSPWKQRLKDCNFLGDAIVFILNSSTNEQLLLSTLYALESISTVMLLNDVDLFKSWFNVNQLVPALVESFKQVNPDQNQTSSHLELKMINNWLTILSNLIEFEVLKVEDIIHLQYDCKIVDILMRILEPYHYPCNIMPLELKSALCIEHSVEIIMWLYRKQGCLNLEVLREIIIIMITLNLVLEINLEQEGEKDFEIENDLLDYLKIWWLSILGILQKDQLLEILDTCEDHVKSNLMKLTQSKENVSNTDLQKLVEALSI